MYDVKYRVECCNQDRPILISVNVSQVHTFEQFSCKATYPMA